ncbi:MAG TPA: hypothetical protein VFP25_06310 [Nitrososphaeraceae archaeon]|nr:hypothetical protein [Nitrososphaeraceae archaeon]
MTTDLDFVSVQNNEGNFIKPSLNSTAAVISSSATGLLDGIGSWKDVSVVNAHSSD